MKDVEVYKKENDDLRQQLATAKMNLRQMTASNKAFQHSYNMSLNELQGLKIELSLALEDLNEKTAEVEKLKVKPSLESVA